MELFYKSNTYMLMSKGISDFHCLSDAYLVEEILLEEKQYFFYSAIRIQIIRLQRLID